MDNLPLIRFPDRTDAKRGAFFLVAFVCWSILVDQGLARPMDLAIAHFFHDRMPEFLAWFFGLVCRTGNVEFSLPLWIILLVLLRRDRSFLPRDRFRQAIVLTVFLVAGSLLEHVMKRFLHQPLPFLNRDPLDRYLHPVISIKTPYSYPSGHTLRAFMVLSLVSVWLSGRHPRLLTGWGLWAILIAIGVNAIGWHWTSDVIGSLLFVGGAWFSSRLALKGQPSEYPGP